MQHKQSAILELRKVLEDGYKKQEEIDAYKVHRVPRSHELGYTKDSFSEYIDQGASGSESFWSYTALIKNTFEKFGLSFSRFRAKTESINSKLDPDSPAALFARQLHELDQIVNNISYFKTYELPTPYAIVVFEDGVISQGYQQHKFRQDKHRDLLYLLWDGRRIVDPEGTRLRKEKPTPRNEIYKKLKIEHDRFKDIVRAVKIEMKRKDIKLDIKFPKDVFIVVTQDSM